MLLKYDSFNNYLQVDYTLVPSYDMTEKPIGLCSLCDAQIISKSYHDLGDNIAVVAFCDECGASFVNFYDKSWNWISEQPLSHFFTYQEYNVIEKNHNKRNLVREKEKPALKESYLKDLANIPLNKLNTIFSPAEIEAMKAKSHGKKYVRQYLYRARKKYKKFYEVFDIILDI